MAIIFPEGTQDYPPVGYATGAQTLVGVTSRSCTVPVWAKWVEIQINDLSTPGTGGAGMCNVQVKNASSNWVTSTYEYQSFTSGYVQTPYNGSTSSYFFGCPSAWTDTLHRLSGLWRLTRMGGSDNQWAASWVLGNNSGYHMVWGGGTVSCPGGMSGISLFTNSNAWDRGYWSVSYGA